MSPPIAVDIQAAVPRPPADQARPRTRRLAPLAFLLGAGALLGVATNLAKQATVVGLAPFTLLAWSCTGAGAALVAIAAWRRRLPPLDAATITYCVVSALLGVVAPNLIFYVAVSRVNVGFVALALAFPPLLTYVGALALRIERLDRAREGGVALALTGAVVLAVRELAAPGADVRWLALTYVGPVLLAAGNLYRTLRWPRGVSADALAPGTLAAAAAMLLLASALPRLSLDVPAPRLAPIALIVVHAASLATMYLLFFQLQKRGGPVLVSLLGSVGAVVGVPVAMLAFAEPAPRGLVVGAALIATGVALVVRGRPAPASATPAPVSPSERSQSSSE